MIDSKPWDIGMAIQLARLVEPIAAAHGCHVALTGGCLYKDGPRKDCDLLFYPRNLGLPGQVVDCDALWPALEAIGLTFVASYGRCQKGLYEGMPVDCLFPCHDGAYPEQPEQHAAEGWL